MLAEAGKNSLQYRGDGGTGWSRAWKINFWARLEDGEHAYELIKQLFNPIDVRRPVDKTVHADNGRLILELAGCLHTFSN